MNRTVEAKWRLFGRHRVHKFSHRQQVLFESRLPAIAVSLDPPKIDPIELFERSADTILEVGFGDGDHLAWLARTNPHLNYIGCEPYANGVAKLLEAIDDESLENIRICQGDARDLLDRLPPDSLTDIHVMFPDPWPKKRHRKRRFVSAESVELMATAMTKGGRLFVSSDIADYARWVILHAGQHPEFDWLAERPADWRTPPHPRAQTKYEKKAVEAGRTCIYLTYLKK